ncbi:hypothetical protein MalM25_13700 [Planctomycetes bacterium MalM25]|nr:hypothetical protein MalM25_13700 [Planctomycetes bacterium MalM25]
MPQRIVLLLSCLLSCGCATVMNGRNAEVAIESMPPGAHVDVRDHEGRVVAQTVTPGSVTLKRGRTWLRPASYVATFSKPGYQPTEAPIFSKLNPWIAGNVLIGGGLGIGVDAVTGALWRPQHSTIGTTLAAAGPLPSEAIAQAVAADGSRVRTAGANVPVR